jgi:hypothetical protein
MMKWKDWVEGCCHRNSHGAYGGRLVAVPIGSNDNSSYNAMDLIMWGLFQQAARAWVVVSDPTGHTCRFCLSGEYSAIHDPASINRSCGQLG